jgi:hypothetical protein
MSEESTMKEPGTEYSTKSEPVTDWGRLETLNDEDIDLSDSPEITPEMFAEAVVRAGDDSAG